MLDWVLVFTWRLILAKIIYTRYANMPKSTDINSLLQLISTCGIDSQNMFAYLVFIIFWCWSPVLVFLCKVLCVINLRRLLFQNLKREKPNRTGLDVKLGWTYQKCKPMRIIYECWLTNHKARNLSAAHPYSDMMTRCAKL